MFCYALHKTITSLKYAMRLQCYLIRLQVTCMQSNLNIIPYYSSSCKIFARINCIYETNLIGNPPPTPVKKNVYIFSVAHKKKIWIITIDSIVMIRPKLKLIYTLSVSDKLAYLFQFEQWHILQQKEVRLENQVLCKRFVRISF